jgi:ribosome-binding protein aMBF1 (putative translation factor)
MWSQIAKTQKSTDRSVKLPVTQDYDPTDDSHNNEFADWTTTVMKKRNPTSGITTKSKFKHNEVAAKFNKIESMADEGEYTKETVSFDLRQQIQKARQIKKYSQAQLANNCNIPVTIIKSYENGSAVPTSAHMNKMSNILGVRLKKK